MKKKVLIVTDKLHSKNGGVPTAILNVASLMQKGHISFDILCVGDTIDIATDFNIISFPVKGFSKFKYSPEAKEWFKENVKNYDIIYYNCVWNTAIIELYVITMKRNVDFYISSHSNLDPFDVKKKNLFKKVLGFLIVNKILCSAKYIVTTSIIEKEKLCYFGKHKDNAIVLPLPVDYDGLEKGNGNAFRKLHGILKEQFVFLFLSRIDYKKGLDLFLYDFKSFIEEEKLSFNDVVIIIAGDDSNEYSTYIRSIIVKLDLDKFVKFTGLLKGDLKADAFCGSDTFILPSHNENFGLSIIESMQAGTPVLISKNVYIYRELFAAPDSIPGWLCEEDLGNIKEKISDSYYSKDNSKYSKDAIKVSEQYKSTNLLSEYLRYFS